MNSSIWPQATSFARYIVFVFTSKAERTRTNVELEIADRCCNCLHVVARLKTFAHILMAVLALGISPSQPVCAAAMPASGGACCCTECPNCKLHHDQPCNQSCAVTQVQTFDKQLPARMALAPCGGSYFLFPVAPTKIKYLVLASVVHRRDLNISPPFGGSPPQAMLRLWLI